MANPLDSIDPNDLDSIDALLDEAEIESISSEGDADLPEIPEVAEPAAELDSLEDDPTDSLLDDLEAELDGVGKNNSFEEDEEPFVPETPVEPAKPSPVKEVEAPPKAAPIPNPEDFLEKRAAMSVSQQNSQELTVAEMDSIKKLIIIFSSVLIVLALAGIGIGVWGAMSAGAGLNEEQAKMLEDVKVGTQQNTQKAAEGNNQLKGVEKKIDALSFQIEQINSDLANFDRRAVSNNNLPLDMPMQPEPSMNNDPRAFQDPHAQNNNVHGAAPVMNDGHGAPLPVMNPQQNPQNIHSVAQPMAYQSAPVAPMQVPMPMPVSVVAQPDPEISEKLSKVSAQIVTAQARIAEVNKRLKDMQAQYTTLLRSVKTVEKEVIADKVEKAKVKTASEALEQDKTTKKPATPYQYTVPGFDYNNNRDGSYP